MTPAGTGSLMRLDGIHHISATTADAVANLGFYGGLLGLRLGKKTVNRDDPSHYHLFYGDDAGSPGSLLTFFEYPTARRGIPGVGMVARVVWRVAGPEAIRFWEERLARAGVHAVATEVNLQFVDHEGLGLELSVDETAAAPLVASHPEIPPEVALQGFAGVRIHAASARDSAALLDWPLGFTADSAGRLRLSGPTRSAFFDYERFDRRGRGGAGTVHHVALTAETADIDAWQRLLAVITTPTPVVDRFYFRSIYFREPSGLLLQLATRDPGVTADEPLDQLGRALSLPPEIEHLRSRIEATLRPLPAFDPASPAGAAEP